jgi:DNA-binding beta-propeller fold protein YncE
MKRIAPFSFARLAGAGALCLLVSCASGPAPSAPPAASLVWPAPPNPARFAYEQSIHGPADLGVKRSTFGRFADWLTGETHGSGAFVRPFGVALDEAGGLCVTDTAAKLVGCFDARARRWHRWTRVDKLDFESPVSVAKRGDVLYVADSGLGQVVAFGLDGKLRFRCGAPLLRPVAVLLSGERLLVADSELHAVCSFSLRGEYLSQFGRRGTAAGEFNYPTHLATDDAGRIYVTDSMNCRVQVFDAAGNFQRQIGSIGDSPGHFSRPKGVAVSAPGHIYVADALFDNVQVFNAEGRLLLPLGEAGTGPGQFGLPAGIAIAPDGRIFIADCFNSRVQVLRYLGNE